MAVWTSLKNLFPSQQKKETYTALSQNSHEPDEFQKDLRENRDGKQKGKFN